MAKSSSLTLLVVAVGGAAVGYFAAQTLPSVTPSSEEPDADTTTEQEAMPAALQGLDYLTLGERSRGEITSASELNGKDGSRFTRYAISLEEEALVEVSLSGALQGTVALYDDQLQLLANAETVRHRIEEGGDYIVVVSGADAHSYGPFNVSSRTIELSDADSMTVGTPVDSWLDATEREITLTIEEAGMYQIEMRADDFDAYLELEGPNGYYREDDDSAGNLNARITDFLAPGEYTLTARSAYGDGNGLFTLAADPRELPDDGELRNDGTVVPNETLSGWFSGQDLTYDLEIDEAGMYQIDMSSSDVDAYLILEGPNGYFREDDDSAGNLDARIADFLAPGSYQLTARTAYGTDSGLFTLAIEPRELPNGVELRNDGAITPDETLNGWYSGEALTYQLTLEESSLVTLTMTSNDFDTYLELYGEGVSYTDDDSGGGTNARLEQALLPGTYTVSARGFSASGSGMFELQVETEPTEMQPDT
ncbi:hypothetical protein [Vreelandella piezotolerans]|uniref:Uncharacterized protein n=1 Tax=Vreelandella piezotolerans TaxID=2609667 RepID=A0ABQ6XEU5_9GAMM|nr:hypothetical protein [Halomonas piezotolerans]KAE8439805.1 hypothetical protein F1978_00690 [Halomonas piezotolerans]QJA23343.1 hypothetical protein GYM47_04075 [Halomonas piezotolerans]